MAQKIEIVTWDEVKEDFGNPDDNNEGLHWGINYLDGDDIADCEWFATMEERNEATKGYNVINYMG